MKTTTLPVLLLLLLFSMLQGQNPIIDSLRIALEVEKNDSVKWELNRNLFSHLSQLNADSTYIAAERALILAKHTKLPIQIGISLDMLGRASIAKNNLQNAQKYFIEASEVLREIGAEEALIDVESGMAKVAIIMKDFELAKKYLRHAYNYYANHSNKRNFMVQMVRFSLLYDQEGIKDSVLYYALKALKLGETLNNPTLLPTLQNNVASGYLAIGTYEKAIEHYRIAIELGKVSDKSTLDHAAYGLSMIFFEQNQIDSSLQYSLLTSEWAKAYGDIENEAAGYEMASKNYALKKDFESAYAYLLKYKETSDTLLEQQYNRDISELSIKYETQKKEAQIAQQQVLLKQEENQKAIFILGAVILLILMTTIFLYFRNRQKARQQIALVELEKRRVEADKLKELDRVKSNFFANISHEFRTPLSLILGPLKEMSENKFKGDSQQYFRMMVRNAERLLHLVNQLLDLSKLESGHVKLETKAVDLASFLGAIVHAFENMAMHKQIYFKISIPEYPVNVYADPDKIEKIITNLLSNAIKFTPKGGRVYFLMKELESGNPNEKPIEFTITDTGRGIPEHHLSHIFDRFYTRTKYEDEWGNIGIGLALTKELVEIQNGSIEVKSQIDFGTTFTVRLPFKAASEAIKKIATPPIDPKAYKVPLEGSGLGNTYLIKNGKPSILVVEDNPELRTYIRNYFHKTFQILEAQNGQQGLERAIEMAPNIIITDIMMPELDGMELCRQLKADQRTQHIPIIMLTARADHQDKLEGLSHGADDYLTKPFDLEELDLRILNLLSRDQRSKEQLNPASGHVSIKAAFAHPDEEDFLGKVVSVIEAYMENEHFSIEELGKVMGMSRSQLNRKIKVLTGHSPSTLIRTIRLENARRLLENNAGNVSEIAFKVGFSNLAYFSRCFSNHFGFPPSEILQQR